MKPAQALSQLLRDMQADRKGYEQLNGLLDEQFQAALSHATPQLLAVAEQITQLVEALEARRSQRAWLLSALLGTPKEAPTLELLIERLPAQAAELLRQSWQALEEQIRQCKQQNLRNCRFITEQHALMQRALGVEEPGYAER